jgi:hypothetical protein
MLAQIDSATHLSGLSHAATPQLVVIAHLPVTTADKATKPVDDFFRHADVKRRDAA